MLRGEYILRGRDGFVCYLVATHACLYPSKRTSAGSALGLPLGIAWYQSLMPPIMVTADHVAD